MPKKPTTPNYWYEHHENLNDTEKVKCREAVCEMCSWGQATFYRYKRAALTPTTLEKMAIAKCYGVELSQFFPKTEPIVFD